MKKPLHGEEITPEKFSPLVDYCHGAKPHSSTLLTIQGQGTGLDYLPPPGPVWGVITGKKELPPGSDPPERVEYEWVEVIPGERNTEDEKVESEVWQEPVWGQRSVWSEESAFLDNAAIEANDNRGVRVGTVVRLYPRDPFTKVIGGEYRTVWTWGFTYEELLQPFFVTEDHIPARTGETAEETESISGYLLNDPERTELQFFGPESTRRELEEEADETPPIYDGICRKASDDYPATRGWARWIARAHKDTSGENRWIGHWQIVTLNASTLTDAIVYDDDIEPGDTGTAQVLWCNTDRPVSEFELINSYLEVQLTNNQELKLLEDQRLTIYFDRHDYRWYPMLENRSHYAKVQPGYTNDSGDTSRAVSVKSCDYLGNNVTGAAFNAYTELRDEKDTALFTDDVVRIEIQPDGVYLITSYHFDDPIGTVKWEGVNVANIRRGWELCDGAATAPDLSAKFIMCIDEPPGGAADENAIGNTGGNKAHGGGVNDHNDHTSAQVATAMGDHADADVANCIATHADHVHDNNHVDEAGADWYDYYSDTQYKAHSDHTHAAHAPSGVDLAHSGVGGGADLSHSATDNRPAYYVMAAIMRVS